MRKVSCTLITCVIPFIRGHPLTHHSGFVAEMRICAPEIILPSPSLLHQVFLQHCLVFGFRGAYAQVLQESSGEFGDSGLEVGSGVRADTIIALSIASSAELVLTTFSARRPSAARQR